MSSKQISCLSTTTRFTVMWVICSTIFFQTHVVSDVLQNSTSYNNTPQNDSHVCKRTCQMDNQNGCSGKVDPSSFSNPDQFWSVALEISWLVNFDTNTISGFVIFELRVLDPYANELILDSRDIRVSKVLSVTDGKQLNFTVGDTKGSFGEPLYISVHELAYATGIGNTFKVQIYYTTSPNSTGLQWLDPLQTAGKTHSYLFSQCQAIHARSIMPCQDTPFVKATYTAKVSVPKDLQALMSARLVGEPTLEGANKIYQFEQKIPIPSYLTAIAVGNIVGKDVGPRSRVWAEPEIVNAAAFEFSETESMIQAAEFILGPYVWGIYDILVLPPSFPFGGMENPCLTFATPTLLAGDKSLVNVIVHEIAHSWTGNLVTNNGWDHFWLNEGFTVFAERKILALLSRDNGEKFREFVSIGGFDELSERIMEMKPDNPLTKLVVDLNGVVDPDDAFSIIPYEKGNVFLFYLEELVGGPKNFEKFMKVYIEENKFKSIDSSMFKSQFLDYFQAKGFGAEIAEVDWDKWFCSPGMPIFKPEYDQTLAMVSTNLANKWIEWDPAKPMKFAKSEFDSLSQPQKQLFLQLCIAAEPFSVAKIQTMKQVYEMDNTKNCEIKSRWIRLCIRANDKTIVPLAFNFVNVQGRMKYVRPIYRDLNHWKDVRPQAIENFKENSKLMMHVTAKMVMHDLEINE